MLAAVTLADRILFGGSMVLAPSIATTETLSTSPFQFRWYRSQLIENIVDKLLSEKFALSAAFNVAAVACKIS